MPAYESMGNCLLFGFLFIGPFSFPYKSDIPPQ